MTVIEKLARLEPSEGALLKAAGIKTIDQLWAQVGRDLDYGLDAVARRTKIPVERLAEMLTAQALAERETRQRSWGERLGVFLVLLLLLFAASGLVLLVVWLMNEKQTSYITPFTVGVLLLLASLAWLLLRADGALGSLPAPFGLATYAPVAAVDLKQGNELTTKDLALARWSPADGHFHHLDNLVGLKLAQDVGRGRTIRYEDVERKQVVAKEALPQGSVLTREALTIAFFPYQVSAALSLQDVVGQKATQDISPGEVIRLDWVEEVPLEQKVIISRVDLKPFQVITEADLGEEKAPAIGAEQFVSPEEVVGRYSLQPVAANTVLQRNQLSQVALEAQALDGRQILSLPVARGAYSAAATPGSRVTLLFSPREASDRPQDVMMVEDAIILQAVPGENGAMTFVFAVHVDLARLASLLGSTELFVVQAAGGN